LGSQSGGQPALLKVLNGEATAIPPIWLMRQAGRYLPEYRSVRVKAGSFLDLCYNPELASEVTLQPIERFDFDAAILFADILLIPHALGQNLRFVEGEGPRLDPVITTALLEKFRGKNIHETLAPVYETVALTRKALAGEKALIGFAGAPWTVATYMLAGGPSKEPAGLRSLWYDQPELVEGLLDILVETTIDYLCRQVEAGADVLQLFDTWAGGLPEPLTRKFSLEPLQKIASAVRRRHPDIPVILFPKGVSALLGDYARLEACAGVSIDFSTSWSLARELITPHAAVQGGLDPMLVVKGGAAMEKPARELAALFRDKPYIFNLGHGLTPDTPPENVGRLVEIIRAG